MARADEPESGTDAVPGDARDRKAEHIRLALDPRMQYRHCYFDEWRFEHNAMPELDLDDVETDTTFLGRDLGAPLLVSCMTGGTDEATEINRNLARAAERCRVAIGVGSQRKALEGPSLADSFRVRPYAPSVPLLANLGAVQLNYGYGVDECRRAVEMIDADALVLHLNPLQEAIQPEGQCNFSDLYEKVGKLVRSLPVPVIVKEVGAGIAAPVAGRLGEQGVTIVDTAGLGGTSWARIEAARAADPELGETFAGWGVPTPEAIRGLADIEGLTIIASGGIRNGVDVAKAVALGASLAGMAYRFLDAARQSTRRVTKTLERVVRELKIAMFCVGARDLERLRAVELRRIDAPRLEPRR